MDLKAHRVVAVLPVLLLTPFAWAQNTHADVPNAKAESIGRVRISGEAGAPYMLWWSAEEALTQVGPYTLFVDPFRSLETGLTIEGFLGGDGQAVIEFPIGLDWDGGRISFQAIVATKSGFDISNLARGTWQVANVFRDAVGIPAAFSILGDLFPMADGRVLAIGGAGPIVEVYEPWNQQTLPYGFAQPMNLLSARARLANGTILVVGGFTVADGQGTPGFATSAEAFLFNPLTGDYVPTQGSLQTPRAGATATLLANGKVLISGGFGAVDLQNPISLLTGILNSTELYDPATGQFTNGPNMLEGKALHTATLLDNGQVMLAGGLGSFFGIPTVSQTAYFYIPGSNSFSLLPKTFTGGRFLHNATKLADGRVILTGGISADLSGVIESGDITQIAFGTLATTAIYNPSAGFGGSFAAGPTMLAPRALHTSTLLASGKVLIAGGLTGNLDIGSILGGNLGEIEIPTPLDSSEILSFSPNATTAGAYLNAARAGASAIVSPMDGRVIVFGGGPLQVELYQQP